MDADADRIAFKHGFVENCKKAGMSLDDMHALLDFALREKTAFFGTGLLARFAPGLAARLGPYAGALRTGLGRAAAVAIPASAAAGVYAGGQARDMALAGAATAPNLYMQALPWLVGLGGAGGIALGSGIGSGLAAADDDAETPEQIKAKELAQTYKTYADQIRAKKQYQLSRN